MEKQAILLKVMNVCSKVVSKTGYGLIEAKEDIEQILTAHEGESEKYHQYRNKAEALLSSNTEWSVAKSEKYIRLAEMELKRLQSLPAPLRTEVNDEDPDMEKFKDEKDEETALAHGQG